MYRFTPLILAPVAIVLAYVAATTFVVSSWPVCAEVADFLFAARGCVEDGDVPLPRTALQYRRTEPRRVLDPDMTLDATAGLDLTALQVAFLASFFVSAGILFVTARRFLSLEAATIALALYLP
jgi:hypothetical protein